MISFTEAELSRSLPLSLSRRVPRDVWTVMLLCYSAVILLLCRAAFRGPVEGAASVP